jgi:hypothetical protein
MDESARGWVASHGDELMNILGVIVSRERENQSDCGKRGALRKFDYVH